MIRDAKTFLSHILQEAVDRVVSRPLYSDFVDRLDAWYQASAGSVDADDMKGLWKYAIDQSQNRLIAFEEQVGRDDSTLDPFSCRGLGIDCP